MKLNDLVRFEETEDMQAAEDGDWVNYECVKEIIEDLQKKIKESKVIEVSRLPLFNGRKIYLEKLNDGDDERAAMRFAEWIERNTVVVNDKPTNPNQP